MGLLGASAEVLHDFSRERSGRTHRNYHPHKPKSQTRSPLRRSGMTNGQFSEALGVLVEGGSEFCENFV